ncbi:MAG: TPM domain-containing protein [Clostridia bacterium]|nr:TPM domain-containing protein [Clostridia bacterium]
MKRKIITLSLLLLMLLTLTQISVFAVNPPVIDEAGYLNSAELADITQRLEKLRSDYNFDVAIVIEENMKYSDAEKAADDIFDYNGYGLGAGKDGILLYLSKNPRKYHISTHGYGITAFTDRGLVHLRDEILPYMEDNKFYNAFVAYAETAGEMLEMARNGQPYNKKSGMSTVIAWAIAIIAPFVIAAFATKARGKRMNTARYQDYANDYMKPGSMNVDVSRDIFVYSNITRTKRVKQSSSTHTSSSGQSHGGIGGSY